MTALQVTNKPDPKAKGFALFANGAKLSQLVFAELKGLNFLPDLIVLPEYPPSNTGSGSNLIHVSSDSRVFSKQIDGLQAGYAPLGLQSEIWGLLRTHEINQVLIACWPYLIDVAELAGLDLCLNLHPSMLPKYPGANPVDEQLSSHETVFGVSLHELTDRFDSGEVVAQKSFLPQSWACNRESIEAHCASIGVNLFLEIVRGAGRSENHEVT